MNARIRWEGNGYGGFLGYAGSLDGTWLFQVWRPEISQWVLTGTLPGHQARGPLAKAADPETLKDRAEELLAGFIASLGAVFPAAPGERPAPVGPFGTREEALAHPLVRAIYGEMHVSKPGRGRELNHRLLCEAISGADVELGAFDHRIVTHLAGDEPQACLVIAGITGRAHEAGVLAGRAEAGQ